MNALAPFYCYFIPDGVTTAFTLDFAKDPYYFDNHVTFGNAIPKPTSALRPPAPDSYVIGAADCFAVSIGGGPRGDQAGGTLSVSTVQNQATFTLSSAPAAADVVLIIHGFIQYA